jgi:hypothetical protein
MLMRRTAAGYAVIGDTRFLPGDSLLLTDDPAASRLPDLPRARRAAFLADMDLLGEAVAVLSDPRDG